MAAVWAGVMVTAARGACPSTSRYPASYADGQAATAGGAFPDGARAADDFFLPLGNGSNYNIRVVKVVMFANFTLTPTAMRLAIHADYLPPGAPANAQPGAIVAGTPNTQPTIRDLGPIAGTGPDGRPLRAYEVAWSLPSGTLQLGAGQWYWLNVWAVGSVASRVTADAAYVAIGANAAVRRPMYKNTATGGTLDTWTSTLSCCLGGPYDMAFYIRPVQISGFMSDINCDLALSVQDVFDFLASWFGGVPGSDYNGVGGTTVQDLFDYLGDWFGSR